LKTKKGKNFVVNEERQLCCSFLHVLQDPMIGNGQKFAMFWNRVQNYFSESCPTSCTPRFARSLETKWGIIKHDVAKFIRNYIVVLVFCESRIGFENTLCKALKLYKTKHPKHQAFTYLHDWYVLKDIP
jgi:hypothetical protein